MEIPSIPKSAELRDAARLYAAQGIYIGPCNGKNPGSILGKNWPDKTTIDQADVDQWFEPGAGAPEAIFMHCGKSCLIAFDIDHPNKLPAVLSEALRLNPPTFWTRKGGERYTALFATAGQSFESSGGALGKDWGDVRAGNSVVIVPPSAHAKAAEGGEYVWKHVGPLPAIPATLSEALRQRAPRGVEHGPGEIGSPILLGSRDITVRDYAWRVAHFDISLAEKQALVLRRWEDVEQTADDYFGKERALAKLDSAMRALRTQDRGELESWQPIDLRPYLDGSFKRSEPTVGIKRNDGLQLLYPAKEHTIIGEMESGKSWLALACAAAEIKLGKSVLYVHFEESEPDGTVERLRALNVADEEILTQFKFVGPREAASPGAYAALLKGDPALTVLDGVNEGMAAHGFMVKEAEGASAFRRMFVTPAKAIGSAVVSLDHVVKAPDSRGRYAIGSIHKGNAIDGAMILLENVEAFGRGRRGRTNVYVTKDRPGYLRRSGKGDKAAGKTYLGTIVVDTTEARMALGTPVLTFSTPPAHEELPSLNEEQDDNKIIEVVRDLNGRGETATVRAILARAGMGTEKVQRTLDRLSLTGRLDEVAGKRNSRIFSVSERPAKPE